MKNLNIALAGILLAALVTPVSAPVSSTHQSGALTASLHGRAITVTTVSPSLTIVHTVPAVTVDPRVAHVVSLRLSNPNSFTVWAEIHYNNGANYVSIPPHSSEPFEMTCEGDSPFCHVANPHVAVAVSSFSTPGTITVSGGFKETF